MVKISQNLSSPALKQKLALCICAFAQKLILDKEEKFLLASALSTIFKVVQNKKIRSGKCSRLPTYQVSFKYLQPFLKNRGVTKLILDKEKILLASALSAIFKVHQNKTKKKKTVSQIFPSTHIPSFIQISSAVSEKQVRDVRTAVHE
jgi:hypothetical protein